MTRYQSIEFPAVMIAAIFLFGVFIGLAELFGGL